MQAAYRSLANLPHLRETMGIPVLRHGRRALTVCTRISGAHTRKLSSVCTTEGADALLQDGDAVALDASYVIFYANTLVVNERASADGICQIYSPRGTRQRNSKANTCLARASGHKMKSLPRMISTSRICCRVRLSLPENRGQVAQCNFDEAAETFAKACGRSGSGFRLHIRGNPKQKRLNSFSSHTAIQSARIRYYRMFFGAPLVVDFQSVRVNILAYSLLLPTESLTDTRMCTL